MLERLWLSGICHNDKIEVWHLTLFSAFIHQPVAQSAPILFSKCDLSADQLVSKVLSWLVVQPNWCHKYDLLLKQVVLVPNPKQTETI